MLPVPKWAWPVLGKIRSPVWRHRFPWWRVDDGGAVWDKGLKLSDVWERCYVTTMGVEWLNVLHSTSVVLLLLRLSQCCLQVPSLQTTDHGNFLINCLISYPCTVIVMHLINATTEQRKTAPLKTGWQGCHLLLPSVVSAADAML